MRNKIVAGNWKMNNHWEEGLALASSVLTQFTSDPPQVKVILGTPYIHLKHVAEMVSDRQNFHVAAQNCHWEPSGAYTGEISAGMVRSTGAEYVILGHSERREYFKESNEMLAGKVDAALSHDLTPIFCCGEPLSIREAGQQVDYVTHQLTSGLFHLSAEQLAAVVIAYEPIWAIGTGKTATAVQAQDMHHALRMHLSAKFGQKIAENISILYGGSCKPDNAAEIFSGQDVDGGLIGGASLNAADFAAIISSL